MLAGSLGDQARSRSLSRKWTGRPLQSARSWWDRFRRKSSSLAPTLFQANHPRFRWVLETITVLLISVLLFAALRIRGMFNRYWQPHRKSPGEQAHWRNREMEIQFVVFCLQFQSPLQRGPLPDVSSSEGRSQRQEIVPLILLKVMKILFQLLILEYLTFLYQTLLDLKSK